jgi:predicted DsbA family dithiol-disulfide isomerase
VQLEIWSDVVCPWCAIGRAHLQQALADHPQADEVELRWRSFELDPSAPAVRDGDLRTHLASKYRTSPDEAQVMIEQMSERAAASGLTFRLDRARGGNTFDAHRLLHLAADRGIQDHVKDRFLTAYLTDGVAIGDRAQLAAVAVDAGLDADEVADVLDGDRYADDVRADEAQAHAFGISGVPFFVLDRRLAVSGAQPAAVLRQALDRAFAEAVPLTVVGAGVGHDHGGHAHDDACADGSCAI